ncbi:Putative DNA repair protein Rad52/59/22 [Septoria linicola]|uniref:RAD52 homolog n=1 Tax=Septoria linicola TaxID=215465 RepID=A0A9Q9EPP6_9PEZI|nr:Putative DNA repair protein Rad52/59/22 [Septoria linicola]
MPAPGDQHRDNANTVNPFIKQETRMSEYTAKEIATLQSRLEKQLGPEYISTRPGNGGGKVHYLAAEKVINLANEVFGFNGWSSSIQNVQIDFVDENRETGRINLGLSTIVRVTLKDGSYHEDIGYGHCENTKGKAAAFEKAKKEAATDAMKRALRNFGNVLGNCLYDKDYLSKITKVKVAPSKWDAENLHRHPDYAPVKKEPTDQATPMAGRADGPSRNTSMQSARSAGSGEFDDDFGEAAEFDETDFSHPDEVRLDDSEVGNGPPAHVQRAMNGQQRRGMSRTHSMPPMRPPNIQPPAPVTNMQAPQKPQAVQRPPQNAAQPANRMMPPHTPGNHQRPPPAQMAQANTHQNGDGVRSNPSSGNTAASPSAQAQQRAQSGLQSEEPSMPPPGAPMGFVSGRAAAKPNSNTAFNPHAESPSIRRTQGVNPGVSAPIRREMVGGQPAAPAAGQQPAAATGGFRPAALGAGNAMNGAARSNATNYINPAADMSRKIGMPQGAGGFRNGTGYKPPSAVKRPAMTDVTNTYGADGASDGGGEVKKAKIESAQVENTAPETAQPVAPT